MLAGCGLTCLCARRVLDDVCNACRVLDDVFMCLQSVEKAAQTRGLHPHDSHRSGRVRRAHPVRQVAGAQGLGPHGEAAWPPLQPQLLSLVAEG